MGARSTEYCLPHTNSPNDALLMLQKLSDPYYTPPTCQPKCSMS